MSLFRWVFLVFALLTSGTTAAEPIGFNRDVRPILADKCFACHGFDAAKREAELRLDDRGSATAEHDSGVAVVSGDPDASELIARIVSRDADVQMPPPDEGEPLTVEEVAVLRQWIAEGAVYERHWAFVAPARPDVPEIEDKAWPRNGVDHFVLARLEAEQLGPSPRATRATLLRRVTLDLTGLPPTIAEMDAFAADQSPSAFERVVDRLLDSPRYGEHMAVAWLDAARYADTNGYNNDTPRYNWPWRSWVIGAFNRNMPFDQFVIEQLAGDLMPEATTDQRVATGFSRNHNITSEGGIIDEEYRLEYVADRVQTTATVFMALSMRCGRCHDHKFDPISQRDYYRFFAFFNQVPEKGYHAEHVGNVKPVLAVPTPAQSQELATVEKKLAELDAQIKERQSQAAKAITEWETGLTEESSPTEPKALVNALAVVSEQRTDVQNKTIRDYYLSAHDSAYKQLTATHKQWTDRKQKLNKAIPTAMVMVDQPQPRKTFMLMRGAYDRPTDEVSPGVPDMFPPLADDAPRNRLGMARWLVDPQHPLTARVAVNRIWYQLFGRGIVETLEDFGTQGARPTHPQLLDYLATDLVAHGWDIKRLQRTIVTSATYQQSSRLTAELAARDADNLLLARGARFRMTAEMIRDNALAVGGLIKHRLGGPSVRPYQPAGLWVEVSVADDSYSGGPFKQDHGDDLYRRSVYTWWKRTCPPPALNTLDAPEREFCTVRRSRTNTPLQSLVLMNDPTFVEAARGLAQRVLAEPNSSAADRAKLAFRIATGRAPTQQEQSLLVDLYQVRRQYYASHSKDSDSLLAIGESKVPESLDRTDLAAWLTVASVILNLDQTITKE